MDELAAELREVVKGEVPPTSLRDSSVDWAAWCLSHLDDVLLRKGLEVSAAIADFLNEMERHA